MVILRVTSILRGQNEDKGMICSIPPKLLAESEKVKRVSHETVICYDLSLWWNEVVRVGPH
jgi:hypothetical protein